VTATPATSPRYVDTAEGARMIRKQLKISFPGVKFSVRISRYSGGSSTNVYWVDGPTSAEVETVTNGFAGGRFDGMIDLAYSANSWWCDRHGALAAETFGHSYDADGGAVGNGPLASRCCASAELVHFGSSFVFATRDLSPEFRAELESAVAKQEGQPYDPMTWIHNGYMSELVYRLSRETSKFVRADSPAT
jgi:Large polyvalent protein associated domain 29